MGLGEPEVIALALELPGATVLLGEREARHVARRSGVAFTGSLGVLLCVKRLRKLDSIAAALGRIREHGAWLSDALVDRVLILAGAKCSS